MANVLVLGGGGFVGRAVCEKWVERCGGAGTRLLVPSRRPARAKAIQMLPTVELIAADIHDDATLARLVGRADAVVNLVGILHGHAAAFDHAHVQLPRRLAQVCVQAKCNRVVHVSALGAAADAPSHYLRSKAAGEAALAVKGIEVTVLRPSVIFGVGDRFLNLFAQLQRFIPVLPLASAHAKFQPVWVDDVATAVVRCLDDRGTIGETIECCGPEIYSLKELAQLAARWAGHPRPVFELPPALARLQATVMEWLPGEPLLSRDNLDSMRVNNIASPVLPGLARLGIQATSLDAIAPRYLGGALGPGRLGPWRAAVPRY